MFVGDLILGVEGVDSYFDGVRDVLRSADLAVGHVEWPHTDRGTVSSNDVPAPAAPLGNLAAVGNAGFAVATLAANHVFDQGFFGVKDTLDTLRAGGIATAGAGLTLAEAREPAIVERGGLRIGVLSYNAVGPRESWASPVKAGGAYVRIHSHYELEMASPGSPPTEFTSIDADSLSSMQDDIAALRERVDVVAVSLHKGMVFERAKLAQYERPLSRAAIDAGADIVVGHHAHILKGVEVYKGRPIFHGVNHFVVGYPPRGNPQDSSSGRTRPERSPILGLMEADTSVKNFPFSADARKTVIATIVVDDEGICSAGFVPCYIDSESRTQRVAGEQGREVVDYMSAISQEAGLSTDIEWDGERATFFLREAGN